MLVDLNSAGVSYVCDLINDIAKVLPNMACCYYRNIQNLTELTQTLGIVGHLSVVKDVLSKLFLDIAFEENAVVWSKSLDDSLS